MEAHEILIFDEKEKQRIALTQELLHCQNQIYKLGFDPLLSPYWNDKINDLQFQIEQLNEDEL